MSLTSSNYTIRKKTSKHQSVKCHVCNITFLPDDLQAGVWGQYTRGGGSLLQRPRHITCIGPRTARAMCGGPNRVGSKVSNGVTFFCSDDERKQVCDQIKRIAWGVKGEE